MTRDFAFRLITQIFALGLVMHSMAPSVLAQLDTDNRQLWHEDSPDIAGTNEDNDFFGAAQASGDFNNDGYPDLAIGSPGESIGDLINAGAVHVLYGGPDGLTAEDSQLWTQETPGIEGTPGTHDQFGGALAAGDFNNDGYDDLAIGAIGEDVVLAKGGGGPIQDAGAVYILRGGPARGPHRDWKPPLDTGHARYRRRAFSRGPVRLHSCGG